MYNVQINLKQQNKNLQTIINYQRQKQYLLIIKASFIIVIQNDMSLIICHCIIVFMSFPSTQQGQGLFTQNPAGSGSLFGNPQQTTSQPAQTGSLFGVSPQTTTQPPATQSLFAAPAQPTVQPSTGSLFSVPSAQPTAQQGQTGSLFGNPSLAPQISFGNPAQATTQPASTSGSLLGNPLQPAQPTTQPATTGSLFGKQAPKTGLVSFPTTTPSTTAANPSTSLFGGLAKPTPAPASGLGTLPATTTTGLNLLSATKPATSASSSLFEPGKISTVPAIITTQTKTQNILFGSTALSNTPNAPDGFFKSSMMPQDAVSQDELIERERLMDAIMGYQTGTMRLMFGSYAGSVRLPLSNDMRNTKIKIFDNDNFKNVLISLLEKFARIEALRPKLTNNQKELIDLLQNYNQILIDKMKLYKEAFLEVAQFSGQITKIQETIEEIQSVVKNQFRMFIKGITVGKPISITRPAEFEVNLSRRMVQHASQLLEQINEMRSSLSSADIPTPSFPEVIAGMIEYFRNVVALTEEFKSTYLLYKNNVLKYKLEGYHFEDEPITSTERNTEKIFLKLQNVDTSLEQMSERIKGMKINFQKNIEKIDVKY